MRALSINPYKGTVIETDIPPGIDGLQAAVRGPIEFLHKFDNGDILYGNGIGEGRFDARFGLAGSKTAAGYGVVVGSVGPENTRVPAVTSLSELRSLVRFAVPKIPGPSVMKISVGQPTGLGPFGAGPDGGTTIAIGGHVPPCGIMLVSELRNPTKAEINLIETGRTQFAFEREDNAAILTCRVMRLADRKELFFETHFHIGLEEEGTRFLPYREGQDPRTVILVLQDENTICRAVRPTVMPPHVCDAIETAVADQVTESATEAAFEEKFNASMQRYYARMPIPKIGFFRARIKG